MAKSVPVRIRLSEDAADRGYLQKLLEALHICVIMEVIQERRYSEQQTDVLLRVMQERLRDKMGGVLDD